MNGRNRVVTTFVVMAVGGALGVVLASRVPEAPSGQALDRSGKFEALSIEGGRDR